MFLRTEEYYTELNSTRLNCIEGKTFLNNEKTALKVKLFLTEKEREKKKKSTEGKVFVNSKKKRKKKGKVFLNSEKNYTKGKAFLNSEKTTPKVKRFLTVTKLH